MRYTLLLTTILFSLCANAKNYYISATGNDANTGTSTAAPWKSISKVNSYFSSMAAGDSILFKRGETFYGTITVNKSGTSTSPIVISAYGTGAMPVISGMTNVTSWTSAGTNLWRSNSLTATSLSILTVNDDLKMKGRWPNSDAASGGYMYYEAVSGTTSVTDNQLTSTPNWTGATIVLKPNPWTIGRYPITSHSGTKLTFSGNKNSIRVNYGYFIQDHLSTLDQQYEWMYNTSTKQITMYSTSAPSNVRVSTTDILVAISSRSYITIKGLQFVGAGKNAFDLYLATGIKIEDCNIFDSGDCGVFVKGSKSTTVQNCNIFDSYNIAVDLGDINNANGIVKSCIIKRTGADPGSGGSSMSAIEMTGNGHTIEGNIIDSSGYNGISFQRGSNLTIKNNVINTFCFVKSDGGGIYTWNNYDPATTYYNNKIIGNIIYNGVGVMYGTSAKEPDCDGIFMDDNAGNIDIMDNTVFNVAGSGIYIHNDFNMNIQRNTLFDNHREQVNFRHNLAYINGVLSSYTTPLRNITFKKNILFSKKSTSTVFIHTTILDDIGSTGTQDSNYFCRPANPAKTITIMKSTGTGTYDLAGYKAAYSPRDKASTKELVTVPSTSTSSSTSSLIGSNMVSNGTFTSSITGISVYSPNKNQVVSIDLLSKLTGTGSLKVTFPTSVSGTYTSLYTSVGAVSSSKKYTLKFKTLGTASNGSVRVYLRKLASPFTVLTGTPQYKTYGTTATTHEFTFSAPTTEASAAVLIELNQNSGTTYIDDIELYETSTTSTGGGGTMEDNIRFEYNPTASSKTVSLDTKYTGIDGTIYNSSIVLAPYSSKILIRTGTTAARPLAASSETTEIAAEPVAEERPLAEPATAGKLKIVCYPNPSPNAFTIVTEAKSTEKVNVTVFNIEGKVVHQTTGSKYDRFTFGNNFAPGTYIVKVMQGADVQTMKLVKLK